MIEKLATAEQVAAVYHTTVGNIWRIASERKWRRIRFGRRVYYHWDEVNRDLGK